MATPESNASSCSGRPRKWSSNAERSRAFRRRRAAKLAEPMRLLERAAQLDRELRTATAEVVSTRKQLTSEHRKLKRITVQHQQVKDRLVTAQAELVRLRDRLRFERDQNVRRSERLGRHGHDGVLGESADFADTDPFDDWSE